MGGNARNFIRVFVLLTVVSAMAFAPGIRPAKAEASSLWKIMPFGDSITTSVGDHYNSFSPQASYRYWLDHALHNALIDFEFMGTQTLNYGGDPKYSDFDHHHEGHSGYQVSNFLNPNDTNYIDKLLNAKRAGTDEDNIPDMVLIHMGTNDVLQNPASYIPTAITNLGLLIDHFRAKNPNVIVLLAQIIPCQGNSRCSNIPAFNQQIPGLALQKNTLASPVASVDLYTGFNATAGFDTYDGVHPNESGEKKMSAKLLEAIQAMIEYLSNRTITQTFIPTVITP
jgi:acyl-CoA thioesterase-1